MSTPIIVALDFPSRDAALALGKIGRGAHMGVKVLLDRSRNDADLVVRRTALDVLVGVVTVGLFAARPADLVILGGAGGIRRL